MEMGDIEGERVCICQSNRFDRVRHMGNKKTDRIVARLRGWL